MGKLRNANAKILANQLVGLSSENKKKGNDIINLYKDDVIGNYRTAENLISKLTARGKGQQKLNDKLAAIKKVNIISSIVRRDVKAPDSSTYLYLNTKERIFKDIYNNPTSDTHQDLFPTVFEETKKMLKNKKLMKSNLVLFF